MRRKDGTGLVRNEERILTTALVLHDNGEDRWHGYRLSAVLRNSGTPMVHSTLYRILKRLEDRNLLESKWEVNDETGRWTAQFRLTADGVLAATSLPAIDDSGSGTAVTP